MKEKTLRDEFAIAALASGEAAHWRDNEYTPVNGLSVAQNMAVHAYLIADALMAARDNTTVSTALLGDYMALHAKIDLMRKALMTCKVREAKFNGELLARVVSFDVELVREALSQ